MNPAYLSRAKRFITGVNDDKTCPPPSFLAFRSSQGFIVTTVCLAIFTDILCYGLIVPVMPFSLTVQASVPDDEVQQWTAILLACYNAALVVGSPIAGMYADHSSSRRWPLLLGLLALCACTVLLCLAKSVALLIVGRLLQGLSAAIVWTVGLALLVDTVGRDIGQAMGWVSIAMAVGLLVAPVIGGAVYAAAGYYTVFYTAFAVIFCDIVLRLVLVEKKVARQWLEREALADDGVIPGGGGGVGATAGAGAGAGYDDNNKTLALDEKQEVLVFPPPASSTQQQDHISSPNADADNGLDARAQTQAQGPEAPPAAVRPHRELAKSRRILAVLLGVVLEAVLV